MVSLSRLFLPYLLAQKADDPLSDGFAVRVRRDRGRLCSRLPDACRGTSPHLSPASCPMPHRDRQSRTDGCSPIPRPTQVFYGSLQTILNDKEQTVIFSNLDDILFTSTIFLSELEERQKSARLYINSIADILAQSVPLRSRTKLRLSFSVLS
jgi:hypothetical protein